LTAVHVGNELGREELNGSHLVYSCLRTFNRSTLSLLLLTKATHWDCHPSCFFTI